MPIVILILVVVFFPILVGAAITALFALSALLVLTWKWIVAAIIAAVIITLWTAWFNRLPASGKRRSIVDDDGFQPW